MAVLPNSDTIAQLTGTIQRVTFHNPDNGFCVLKVSIAGKQTPITVIGNAIRVNAGETIEAKGQWHNDPHHGLQFKSEKIDITPPNTLSGIEKYLASGMVKGIGPVYAKNMVKQFGINVLHIIDKEPEQLKTVPGIGKKRLACIKASWAEQKTVRDIMVFLHSYGVGTGRAVRIYKTYGDEAIQQIQRNPYCLARDIHGIGFQTADKLAMELGIPKTSLERAQAGIEYILQTFANHGHCAAEHEACLQETQQLLDVDSTIVTEAMTQAQASGYVIADVVNDIPCYYRNALYQAEVGIAKKLMTLKSHPCPWSVIDASKAIPWVEEHIDIKLSSSQQEAISQTINSKITIITGGPGVGKTTLVNSILKILNRKQVSMALCAPTGRAAKRLSESTGLLAKTIHRLLDYQPHLQQFKHNENCPLPIELLVMDEASMVDINLMFHLLTALPKTASLLLVGDVDQLPSVGPGSLLKDCILSQCFTVVHLTEVFRQAQTSQIIANAHRINAGKMPITNAGNDKKLTDFYFMAENDEVKIQEKLIRLVAHHIPKRFGYQAATDIQVLSPMQRSGLGAHSLNIHLQKALNPHFSVAVTRFGATYAVGDKVMQIVNNYDKEVYNGDIGFITAIDEAEKTLTLRFDQCTHTYNFTELDELQLAYACTIHKSQGSEYPVVVIPLAMQHFMMLQRNLLYTAVTRGKALVVIIGDPKALAMAIQQEGSNNRFTGLQWRLQHRLF
ncbi:MAG: SF1B family DNA helicase RecD2 [Gammaproteobacteria bacterium]